MKRPHAILLTSLVAAAVLMAPGTALAATAAAAPAAPADAATKLEVGDPAVAVDTDRGKIDVMGIWAHPDDDAGFTTPCGVWNDLYGVRCGIIMATRGEGGSNSVGPEAGPDLGVRRENEDRTSHIRSGTVDIFNLDRVDFYYNTSAALTAQVWDAEETLRRTVRIIRETQPEILVGSTPSLAAGHGNHQYAQGRMIWEAAAAAADPGMFPEQLEGTGAVDAWQVKKILAGGLTTGSGGAAAPNCNTGFAPAATNPFTVVGTWTGYDSPYAWAEGNVQGQQAGTAKTWAQVGREGGRAHPTQARVMEKGLVNPSCQRYGASQSIVPMQPNSSPASANDDAVLYGAVVADPGGMPLGSEFSLAVDEYYQAPGEPFEVTVSARSGEGRLGGGTVSLTAPAGWQVSEPVELDGIGDEDVSEATFTVTPAADAAVGVSKLAASFDGEVTAYNDTRVALVAPVEGRFERWGNMAEYEQWTRDHDAYVGGRSNAVAQIGAGETMTVPVEVTNRTAATESGEVALTVPAGFVVDAASKPFEGLAPGDTTTVEFVVTHTDPADPGSRTVTFTATTTSGAGTSSENETVYLVPTVVIPELASAPAIDGAADDVYTGDAVDVGTRWEGAACAVEGVDCGDGSLAKLGWFDDALYAQIRVTDDIASAAATPDRCFGHWLVDSVELLLDPRGDSVDTSSTFKLGMFPFTDDAEGTNGNGEDGPCWSRDADNHQGFSTGPLAETVEGGLNAVGVEVAVHVARQADGTYAGGGYELEVKVPLSALPAAAGPTSAVPSGDAAANEVDPTYLGLNVTPYDSDTQDFIGQTRTAWSAFGSQQSEPYRWGHAYLDGYVPPADRSTEPSAPIIPDTALQGVQSPQTVAQSATRGGTISGVQPSDALNVTDVKIQQKHVRVSYAAKEAGAVRVFLWKGDTTFIPVWTTSCAGDVYGFEACSATDGAAPPWAPDMSGRLLGSFEEAVDAGTGRLTIPLDAATRAALADDARILVSYAEQDGIDSGTGDGVNAWSFPIEATRPGKG
ncbi:NEW3 domain-containing protein [Agromyces lapidis]|uniref:NEW3 domain-containing protein n=1 Tax=Agromyces lapidis TaxID=279574 RepID=A0ABV5SK49_9MICO|nr:NEW3 domain-containing protein [Agromyces lapidis]